MLVFGGQQLRQAAWVGHGCLKGQRRFHKLPSKLHPAFCITARYCKLGTLHVHDMVTGLPCFVRSCLQLSNKFSIRSYGLILFSGRRSRNRCGICGKCSVATVCQHHPTPIFARVLNHLLDSSWQDHHHGSLECNDHWSSCAGAWKYC